MLDTARRTLPTLTSALLAAATTLLVLLTPAGAGPRWPRCATEGQVTGPCVWDARHMGNGTGLSFKVYANGNVKHVTHRHAHRLAQP